MNGSLQKAISLSLLTTLMLALMNAFAKWAGETMAVMDVTAWRSVLGLGVMVVIGFALHGRFTLRTQRPFSHLTRSLLGHGGVALVFWAYQRMPMAEATTILYTAPLMTVLLAVPLLGERVGPWRLGGCLLGLVGVGVMTQSGSGALTPDDLMIGLAAALGVALVNIVLRDIGKTDDPLVTVNWFFIWGSVIGVPWLMLHPIIPPIEMMLVLGGVTVCAVIAHLAKTEAARMAEASLMAPLHYVGIIWAIGLGMLLFHDVPTIFTLAGAGIIIGGNALVIWREYVHQKKNKTPSSITL